MHINPLDKCVYVRACACQKCDFRLMQEVSYSHGLEGGRFRSVVEMLHLRLSHTSSHAKDIVLCRLAWLFIHITWNWLQPIKPPINFTWADKKFCQGRP